jgi:hypothetical protein
MKDRWGLGRLEVEDRELERMARAAFDPRMVFGGVPTLEEPKSVCKVIVCPHRIAVIPPTAEGLRKDKMDAVVEFSFGPRATRRRKKVPAGRRAVLDLDRDLDRFVEEIPVLHRL